MDILSWNTGYFLGYDGTLRDYLRHPLKGVIGTRQEADALDRAADRIDHLHPELVLLQEVDTGSYRTRTDGQAARLAARCSHNYRHHATAKYRNPVLRRAPLMRHMGNAVLHRGATVTDRFLATGIKSLVQQIEVDGLTVFNVHLARFGARIRREQLLELGRWAAQQRPSIIIGDVNAMKGLTELAPFRDRPGWCVAEDGETFPAEQPRYPVDCAIHPETLSVTCRRLPYAISDHRPVLFTVEP